MDPPARADQIDALLEEIEAAQPVAYDLGVPEPPAPQAVEALVAMGPSIVPRLLVSLQGDVTPKQIAAIVQALNFLGDVRALAPLRALRARYEQRANKDEWDDAIIGQANLAIERLQSSPL